MKQIYVWLAIIIFIGMLIYFFYQTPDLSQSPEVNKTPPEKTFQNDKDSPPVGIKVKIENEAISEITGKIKNPIEKTNPFSQSYQNPFSF